MELGTLFLKFQVKEKCVRIRITRRTALKKKKEREEGFLVLTNIMMYYKLLNIKAVCQLNTNKTIEKKYQRVQKQQLCIQGISYILNAVFILKREILTH